MDRTSTAAGVKCFINGRDMGWVTGVTFDSATPHRAYYGIDSLKPFELIPTNLTVSGTISVIKMFGDGGSLEYQGIVSGFNKVITEKYFTLLLTQHTSAGASYVIFRADECSVDKQSWSFQNKQIVTGTFTFQGIEWTNPSTQADT